MEELVWMIVIDKSGWEQKINRNKKKELSNVKKNIMSMSTMEGTM